MICGLHESYLSPARHPTQFFILFIFIFYFFLAVEIPL